MDFTLQGCCVVFGEAFAQGVHMCSKPEMQQTDTEATLLAGGRLG